MNHPHYAHGTPLREWVFWGLLTLYILCGQTWLFQQFEAGRPLVIGIKAAVPLLLLLLYRKTLHDSAVPVLGAYAIVVAYFFIQLPMLGVTMDRAVMTAKFIYPITFFFALVLILQPVNFSRKFLRVPCAIAGLLALQTILLFALCSTGHAPPSSYVAVTSHPQPILSYGLFGYGHGSNAIGSELETYRAQSFFGEPTGFANFLQAAIFISFGLWRTERRRLFLLCAGVCLVALVLAFSMTGYISFFLTCSAYFLFKRQRRLGMLLPVAAGLVAVACVGVVLFYLFAATSADFYGQDRASLSFGHSRGELEVRLKFLLDSLAVFREAPLGVGVLFPDCSPWIEQFPGAMESRSGPLLWLVMLGFVGIFAQLFIVGYAFNRVLRRFNLGDIGTYVGLAFIASATHECVGGDWLNPMFLFLLASVLTLHRWAPKTPPTRTRPHAFAMAAR